MPDLPRWSCSVTSSQMLDQFYLTATVLCVCFLALWPW